MNCGLSSHCPLKTNPCFSQSDQHDAPASVESKAACGYSNTPGQSTRTERNGLPPECQRRMDATAQGTTSPAARPGGTRAA